MEGNPKIWSDCCCQKFFACASPTCPIFFRRDSGTLAAQHLQGSNSLYFANFGNNNMFPKSANVQAALGSLLVALSDPFVTTLRMQWLRLG